VKGVSFGISIRRRLLADRGRAVREAYWAEIAIVSE